MMQVCKTMIHIMVYNNIMQNIRNTVGSGIVSTCTSNDESQSVSSTIECDIGKLKDSRVYFISAFLGRQVLCVENRSRQRCFILSMHTSM